MRLLNEGRYSILEFLVCSRHATPNFGVLRPQPLQIQPVNVPQPQPVNFPQPQLLHIEPVNAPRPPSPILLELPHHQLREEILARLLPPPQIRQPVSPNLFDVSSDSDDEENVIARPQANQIQNQDLNILENSNSDDEQNMMARS
ncbi:unnamed protein product [Aphis gossypii]|uniref:Uncharacterized protein n=1 Tax=Aphis gossypii TaxID=80765 RepID=A0A9P0JCU7_APHGO|nr:unnamed protein product [Aphis gossypii]